MTWILAAKLVGAVIVAGLIIVGCISLSEGLIGGMEEIEEDES